MRIYIFKSEMSEFCAFAGDAKGSKLPSRFEPWHSEGIIESDEAPPHNFSRFRIESAIKIHGFQLWRVKSGLGLSRFTAA